MKMTKQEAIENHRKLWNWIADTSEKKNRCVGKYEYFEYFGLKHVKCNCYCCEYSNEKCKYCPIVWMGTGKSRCPCMHVSNDIDDLFESEFGLWKLAYYINDVKECVRLARIIANLPENPNVE